MLLKDSGSQKKFLVLKLFGHKKMLGRKRFFHLRFLGPKYFHLKNFLVQKNFGCKYFVESSNIFAPQMFWVQKLFDLKIFWFKIFFWVQDPIKVGGTSTCNLLSLVMKARIIFVYADSLHHLWDLDWLRGSAHYLPTKIKKRRKDNTVALIHTV